MNTKLKYVIFLVVLVLVMLVVPFLLRPYFQRAEYSVLYLGPPPGVYDVNGKEQSWDWLAAKYPGVAYARTSRPYRFELVAVRETVGPCVAIAELRGLDGSPNRNWVGLYWPNPEKRISTADVLDKWQPYVAAAQYTDVNGQTGFGLGAGSVIKGDKGPHWMWVLSPTAGSDALGDFGWLGGTDHACPCRAEFRLATAPPTATPSATAKLTSTPKPTAKPTATATSIAEPSWIPYDAKLDDWQLPFILRLRPR